MCAWWRLAQCVVFDGGCVTAERNGSDVPADERLPHGALAEADLQSAKRSLPVLIRTRTTRIYCAAAALPSPAAARMRAVPSRSRPKFLRQGSLKSSVVKYIGRKLRNRVVPETTILKENRSFRDHANYIYPSSSGERSAEARKGMGDEVTRDLMNRGPSDPFTPSVARSVEPLKEGEKPALKEAGR